MEYKKKKLLVFATVVLCLLSCSGKKDMASDGYDETYRMICPYFSDRNLDRMLTLIDSMEQAGRLDATNADLLRGFSYDASWNMRLAEHFYSKAFYSYKKPISDWAKYAEAGYRLSTIFKSRNNFQQSLSLSLKLLAESDGNPRFPASFRIYSYINVGDCQFKLHQYDDARQNYLKAYREMLAKEAQEGNGTKGSDPMIMSSGVCQSFMAMGDYDEAEAWLSRFRKHYEEYAVAGSQQMIKEYRTRLALYKADILLGQGRKAQATALFDSIPPSQIDNPGNIIDAANFLMAIGRYADATKYYAMFDSVYIVSGDRQENFSIITDEMVPRFKASLFSNDTAKAMSLAVDISQAIDSAVSRYYQDDLAELAVIYKLHEQETIKNREQLHKEMWRLAAVTLMLLFMVVSIALVVYVRQNRTLKKKSYDLTESKRKLVQIDPDNGGSGKQATADGKADFKQNLYFRLCEMLEKEKCYTNPDLKREDLASMLGTNYKYVCDAIRECTSGMSVNEFLNMKRLEYASHLLLASDMTVREIADISGFNSGSYFIRLFRNRYGLPPTEYRKTKT